MLPHFYTYYVYIFQSTLRDASKYIKQFKKHLKRMKIKEAHWEDERRKIEEAQTALEIMEQEENETKNKEKEVRT